MAEKLNVEQPPAGQAGPLEQAAAAAQMPTPPLVGNPDFPATAALAQEQAAQGISGANEPPAVPAQPTPTSKPVKFTGPTGILQAPAAITQPIRSDVERDQQIQLMWNVMADSGGSALTRLVRDSLSGVD